MGDVKIRLITPDDDLEAQMDLGQRAFGVYPPQQRAEWMATALMRARQGLFLGAFVDGVPAGAAMVHDMRQYWGGRSMPMAGVASVKVGPEYRGRGIGRRLMSELLGQVARRGYPLSALFPATMPIYRSLGYELAGGKYVAAIPARSLRTLLAPDAHAAAGGYPAAPGAAAAGRRPLPEIRRASPDDVMTVNGVIGRSHAAARDAGPVTWDVEPARQWLGRPDLYSYLAGDEGFTAYRWAEGSEELLVERVHASTPEALRALWGVIASHSSVARTVRVLTAPNGPVWWLTHERDPAIVRRSMWMLRVVDAPAAVAGRGFPAAVTVSVPLIINDAARPANSGNWHLAVADGKGTLDPDTGAAGPGGDDGPLTLGARGLAALYAGTPLATLRLAGLASGGGPDSDAALDSAFAATPYMVDDF